MITLRTSIKHPLRRVTSHPQCLFTDLRPYASLRLFWEEAPAAPLATPKIAHVTDQIRLIQILECSQGTYWAHAPFSLYFLPPAVPKAHRRLWRPQIPPPVS